MYGVSRDFERVTSLLCVRNKNFWLRIGSRLDVEELVDPVNKLILKLCRAVAADHGWPDEGLVVQRAAHLMNEGSVTDDELGMLAEALGERLDVEPEKVINELISPVRKDWSAKLARKVVDRYKNDGLFGNTLLDEMAACDALGAPVAEVELASSEFGEDTEEIVREAPTGRKLLTGLYELDTLWKGGWPLGTLLTWLMDSKAGKCCAFGTKTLLHSGAIVNVEDIQVGDQLQGPDGTPRRVLSTVRGEAQMYEVRPHKGESFKVNEDHILTLADMGSPNHGPRTERGWVDVSVKEWLGWDRHKKARHQLIRSGPVEFSGTAPLPVDPYFLGVLLGDGHTKYSTVSVCTADHEILDVLVQQAEVHGLDLRCDWKDGAASTFFMSRKKGPGNQNVLTHKLRDLGLMGKGSGTKSIPEIYKRSSIQNRWQLLAGLMDTDGSSNGGVSYDYVSKSEQLAQDVAFVARSLGMSAYVKVCTKGCQTGAVGTYYRVAIAGAVQSMPCKVDRKKPKPRARGHHRETRLDFTVIPTGKVEKYAGFNLDGDGRYLLGDFTVTHNSMYSCYFAACALLQGENCGYLSLELPRAEIHKRVLAAIVGVPISDLEDPRVMADALKIWRDLKKHGKIGRLFIEKLEAGTVDTVAMATWFRHQEKVHDVRIRFRVVDYGDLVISPKRGDTDNAYTRGQTVWQAMANMAQDVDNPNWVLSPTQSKRPDWKPGQPIPMLNRSGLADSIHKVRITDFLVSATPQPDIKATAGYLIYVDADRFMGTTGTPAGTVPHFMNMARMGDMGHILNRRGK